MKDTEFVKKIKHDYTTVDFFTNEFDEKLVPKKAFYEMRELIIAQNHQLTQLKQFAREASRVVEFYSKKSNWRYSNKVDASTIRIDDHDFFEGLGFGKHLGGKTARQFLNSDIYKQVIKEIEE